MIALPGTGKSWGNKKLLLLAELVSSRKKECVQETPDSPLSLTWLFSQTKSKAFQAPRNGVWVCSGTSFCRTGELLASAAALGGHTEGN